MLNKVSQDRKGKIAANFGQAKDGYERYAQVQERAAKALADMLPALRDGARILEFGCGTGFLTKLLLQKYPNAHFDITDISPEMLQYCREACAELSTKAVFYTLDAERDSLDHHYDLIVSAMTVQWFDQPTKGLLRLAESLSRDGSLYYSTIGSESFVQWRSVLNANGIKDGLITPQDLPNVFARENYDVNYVTTLNFLQEMKATGAALPRDDYMAINAGELRRLCRLCDAQYHGRMTWQIVFGKL